MNEKEKKGGVVAVQCRNWESESLLEKGANHQPALSVAN